MSIATLRAFFMWCTIVNGAVLVFSAVMCTFASGFIYRVHSRWYSIPRPTFTVVLYAFLGVYKLLFITFNVVPLVALAILE